MRALPGYQRLRDTCAEHNIEVFESVMGLSGMVNVGKGALVVGFACGERAVRLIAPGVRAYPDAPATPVCASWRATQGADHADPLLPATPRCRTRARRRRYARVPLAIGREGTLRNCGTLRGRAVPAPCARARTTPDAVDPTLGATGSGRRRAGSQHDLHVTWSSPRRSGNLLKQRLRWLPAAIGNYATSRPPRPPCACNRRCCRGRRQRGAGALHGCANGEDGKSSGWSPRSPRVMSAFRCRASASTCCMHKRGRPVCR